jgi:hypothetical protein
LRGHAAVAENMHVTPALVGALGRVKKRYCK